MNGVLQPGLFDIQVNGFAGVDFNSPDCDAAGIDHALGAMLDCGVTGCLPTLITASAADLAARFAALDRAVSTSRLGPLMVPGYHLEGPFLNTGEGYAGCHPVEWMTEPDAKLVGRLEAHLTRPILLVTIAPELPGAEFFIRRMVAAGRVVAVGHSAADPVALGRAVEAGASLSTHLGNGLPQVLPKLDNTVFAQLAEDGLWASFIADGIHVGRTALRVMIRAKGLDRCILTTDAISAAGAPPGFYPFAGMIVEHGADGSARVPGARSLAGSGLKLDDAVRNVVAWGLVSVNDAFRMASHNPRHLLARAFESHGIRVDPGVVEWSPHLTVDGTRLGRTHRRPTHNVGGQGAVSTDTGQIGPTKL